MNEVYLCRRCGRKLKTDEAKSRGYGKICWEKSRLSLEKKPLFRSSDYAENSSRVPEQK